jgi:hypothetical protein
LRQQQFSNETIEEVDEMTEQGQDSLTILPHFLSVFVYVAVHLNSECRSTYMAEH